MATFGIDLGTTYSCIAKIGSNDLPEVIPNFEEDSDHIVPSVIYFESEDVGGAYIVGKQAKEYIATDPERVVQFIKREITEKEPKIYHIDGTDYDPVSLSALILKKIKKYAEDQEGEVSDVVITVPAYFDIAAREATKQAGVAAGLNVLSVINEPTAAALSYIVNSADQRAHGNYLVYDLGGGTFDVTLISVTREGDSTSVTTVASNGNSRLGGADWDARLSQVIREKYLHENGMDEADAPEELKYVIAARVEQAKRKLTSVTTAKVNLECDGAITPVVVTREEFENVTRDLVERTMQLTENVLQAGANHRVIPVREDEIDLILLVGGSTSMPMIQAAVKGRFGEERVRVADPSEAVAKGAALFANMLVQEQESEAMLQAINKFIEQNGRKPMAEDLPTVMELAGLDPVSVDPGPQSGANPGDTPVPPVKGIQFTDSGEIIVEPPKSSTTLTDVFTSSFGPCVLNADNERVVDNIVLMGELIDNTIRERTYYTPRENMEAISVQVFESRSAEAQLPPCMDRDENPIAVDPKLGMQYHGRLVIQLPPNTPAYTEVIVQFEFKRDNTASMTVHIPSLGISRDLEFKFYKGDVEKAKKAVDSKTMFVES